MRMYIGLDVHSKFTVYCAQDEQGTVLSEGKVFTSADGLGELIRTVEAPVETKIALESGGQATWVSRLLTQMGMCPVVINAYEVRAKARRVGQKSDSRDAFELCDGLRRDIYTSIVYVPDPDVERLRRVLSRRRHFVRLCTNQILAAKFLLRTIGLGGEARTFTHKRAWVAILEHPAVAPLKTYLTMHLRIWEKAREMVERLDKELERAMRPFEKTRDLLQTAPSVGRITSATFLAVLGNPYRFPTSGHVVSYVGLAPSCYDSGESTRHGGITKRGSSELRAMLCESAQHARRPAHPLHPYFRRIVAAQGYKRAVVAVAQRLARILYRIWRYGQPFDTRKLNVVQEPKVSKKVILYRIRRPEEARAQA